MKWKGTIEDPEFAEDVIDDDYDEDEYPVWEKRKKRSFSERVLNKIEIPFILVAAGLVIVIIVFFISLTGRKDTVDVSRIDMLEQRLSVMEDRLFKLEGIRNATEAMGEQNKTIDMLQAKVSQLESAVATRMDQLSDDLTKLSRKTASAGGVRSVVQKEGSVKEAPAKTVVHQVRSGDTLFGIGRRYGVSVEALRRLNNIPRGKSIFPGQKLIVRKSGSR